MKNSARLFIVASKAAGAYNVWNIEPTRENREKCSLAHRELDKILQRIIDKKAGGMQHEYK